LYEKIVQLKLESADGKKYETDCASTEGILRVIQSIPSSKAEPFKRWLAQVGSERLDEIENPELAAKRMREIYKAKGYSDEWIEKRVRGIAVRDELTNEWKKRGVCEPFIKLLRCKEFQLVNGASEFFYYCKHTPVNHDIYLNIL
jgi:hypothetical protein